jgi:amino acid transporter
VPAGVLFQSFAKAHLGFTPPWWVGGVAFMLIVFAMQSAGVALSVRAQLALTTLSAIPIVIVVVAVIIDGGTGGNTLSVFSPFGHGHNHLFSAILFAVTLFIGFECAAALGAETANPHRSIPRAVMGSVAITSVWFLVIMYAGTIGFGPQHSATLWGASPNGLADLAHRYVGSADATAIQAGVLLDMLAVWLAMTNSFSRVAYALAKDRMLPSAYSRTTSAGVPWVGNITWVVATLGMLVATALAHVGGYFNMLTLLVIPGSLAVLAIYALLALAAVKLVRPGWQWLVLLLAAAVPVLGIYGTLHPFPVGPLRWGVWLAAIGLGAGIAWMAYLQFGRQAFREPA